MDKIEEATSKISKLNLAYIKLQKATLKAKVANEQMIEAMDKAKALQDEIKLKK